MIKVDKRKINCWTHFTWKFLWWEYFILICCNCQGKYRRTHHKIILTFVQIMSRSFCGKLWNCKITSIFFAKTIRSEFSRLINVCWEMVFCYITGCMFFFSHFFSSSNRKEHTQKCKTMFVLLRFFPLFCINWQSAWNKRKVTFFCRSFFLSGSFLRKFLCKARPKLFAEENSFKKVIAFWVKLQYFGYFLPKSWFMLLLRASHSDWSLYIIKLLQPQCFCYLTKSVFSFWLDFEILHYVREGFVKVIFL